MRNSAMSAAWARIGLRLGRTAPAATAALALRSCRRDSRSVLEACIGIRPNGFHEPPAEGTAEERDRRYRAVRTQPTPRVEARIASAQDERSGRVRIGRPGSTGKAVVGRHTLRRYADRPGNCRRDIQRGKGRRYARNIANGRRIIASAGAAPLAIRHVHSVSCRHGHLQVRDGRAHRVNDRSRREQGDEDRGKEMSEPFHARRKVDPRCGLVHLRAPAALHLPVRQDRADPSSRRAA